MYCALDIGKLSMKYYVKLPTVGSYYFIWCINFIFFQKINSNCYSLFSRVVDNFVGVLDRLFPAMSVSLSRPVGGSAVLHVSSIILGVMFHVNYIEVKKRFGNILVINILRSC